MATKIDDINLDPQFKVAMSDIVTLSVMQNFCLDNLKAIFEKIISSKKVQDQLNDNNDLMNYMVLVLNVMEEFLLRINQNFYHNKELEENEFLQKQTQESEERLEELNHLFAQVMAIQLAKQKVRESEYATKKVQLENDLKLLNKELRQAIINLESRKAQLSQTNQVIEKTFDMILNNISSSSAAIEIVHNGKTLRISQDESNRAIKNELREDFENGTFNVDGARPKVKNAFIKLGMKKLTENNIEHTKQSVATVDQMAETQTNKFMESMYKDINLNKLNSSIQEREIQKSELNKAEETVAVLEVEVTNKKEAIVELRQDYSDVVSPIKAEMPKTEAEFARSNDDKTYDDVSDDDIDNLDPFAQITSHIEQEDIGDQNRNRPDDDEFPPPPGDPDNNNYPYQSPPNYNEASVSPQQPEPSALPQEQVDYPAPSAPPLEEAPITNEPSPAYVGRRQATQPSSAPVEPINNAEAKIAAPQPEKNFELNSPSSQPPHAELKEIKSSGGILGKLGMTAGSLRQEIEKKKTEASIPITKKDNQHISQQIKNDQTQQKGLDEPENKGPKRSR